MEDVLVGALADKEIGDVCGVDLFDLDVEEDGTGD